MKLKAVARGDVCTKAPSRSVEYVAQSKQPRLDLARALEEHICTYML